MHTNGLLLVLDNIINSILVYNYLDSWIMYNEGFKNAYSQLNLTFKMTSGGKNTVDYTYKKKPQRQVARDKYQSHNWKYADNICTKMVMCENHQI